MVPVVFKGLASAAQYFLPLLFVVAAIVSWVKRNKAEVSPESRPRTKPQSAQPTAQSATDCPLCSGTMVLRAAKKGNNAGKSFWGCSNYPRCKGTRPAT
jgi:hypothetical protein